MILVYEEGRAFPVDAQFDRGLGPGGLVLAVDRADADVVGRADENWASRAVIGRDGGAVVGRGVKARNRGLVGDPG